MKTTILAFLAVLSPLVSRAADEIKIFDVKPGLWETTSKSEMAGLPAMASMPQIPEESLAKMPPRTESAGRSHDERPVGGPQTNTSRSCVTRESLSRGFGQMDKTCTYKVVSSSASKMDMHIECNRASGKAEGEVIMERADPEHVKGTVNMKAASGGSNFSMKVSNDSKWISADCGDVKPPEIK